MNICRNILSVALALCLLPGCLFSSEDKTPPAGSRESQCDRAIQGELDIKAYRSGDPALNSHLLNCAVAIVVPLPDEERASVLNRTEKKRKVADFLITQNLDTDYKDETGTTLLMAVVISYMPNDWKLKASEILLTKGVSIDAENVYGKTALDLAEFSKDSGLVEFLREFPP